MPYATTPAAAPTILAAAIPLAATVRSFEVTTLFDVTLFFYNRMVESTKNEIQSFQVDR